MQLNVDSDPMCGRPLLRALHFHFHFGVYLGYVTLMLCRVGVMTRAMGRECSGLQMELEAPVAPVS
jgi:hypothetical protein